MKLLYFTDTHIMGRNPGIRIDDYPSAIFKKFKDIEQVAKTVKPDAMIHGGDFFDQPRIALSIINKYMRVLRRIKKMGIPIYLVPGNHDLYGYSMDTLNQTAIGLLARSGLVTLLTQKKSYTISNSHTGVEVEIYGREYDKDIDKDPKTDYQIDIQNKQADVHLLFAHGMLLDKPFHPDVRHTLTKDVTTDADAVFCGHYHPGYPIHTMGNTIFVNNGSTARDEGSQANIQRLPMYTVIEIDSNGVIRPIAYPFSSAQPGKDVFDIQTKANIQQHTKHLEAFERTIQDAMVFQAFDPKDVITKMTGAVDQLILDKALDSIVDAEKLVQDPKIDGYVEKKKPIAITKIEIENFQSHRKTVIELNAKGLNALTGSSDSGKSAVIRALRWVFYNEPKGADFIRHGQSRATVCVHFSDGSSITRSRTATSAGEYVVRDVSGKETEFKGFGANMPVDIANTHQMPKVELSTGMERPLNFSYQLDGHFLLSESPQVRAATIGRLTGVHIVDAAIKERTKELRSATAAVNTASKRVEELDTKLEEFKDLATLEGRISKARGLLTMADNLNGEISELVDAARTISDAQTEVLNLEQQSKRYHSLDVCGRQLDAAEQLARDIADVRNLRSVVRNLKTEMDELTERRSRYAQLSDGEKLLDAGEKLVQELAQLQNLDDELDIMNSRVKRLSTEAKQYENLSETEKNLDEAGGLIDEINHLHKLEMDLAVWEGEVSCLEAEQSQRMASTLALEKKVQALMQEMGNKCPTCNQTVDTTHLLEHV